MATAADTETNSAPVEAKTDGEATADEIAAPPEAVNMTDEEELGHANNKDNSESGKLKALLGILKRMMGVKDLAAIRLSLPANLLEPVPNLEYWTYLDRADLFTTIGDFDDPLDRMLAALRFTFTKELKFVHGKVCKPYNSILGEHFRCHWDVISPDITEDGELVPKMGLLTENPSPLQQASCGVTGASSSKRGKLFDRRGASSNAGSASEGAPQPPVANNEGSTDEGSTTSRPGPAKRGLSKLLTAGRNTSKSSASVSSKTTSTSGESEAVQKSPSSAKAREETTTGMSKLSLDEDKEEDDDNTSFKTSKSGDNLSAKRRISFLTEQVSHHPPISSFFVESKDAGIQLYGVDQLSAKFTGTNVRIFPGDQNQGIFARLTESCRCGAAGEEYQITHPTASVNGLLRGSLWVAICDTLYVTCRGGKREGEAEGGRGSRLRSIVEYKDESWVLKAKYALEGVIYEYDPAEGEADEKLEKVKDVPLDRIVATFEGTWRGRITWKKKGDKDSKLLIDLDQIDPIAKAVRPLEAQEPMESRKIWEPVTTAILQKEFGSATKHKQDIEQMQRDAAADRKKRGEEFVPRFFHKDISNGRPKLTDAGREALDGEHRLEGYEKKDA